MKLKCFRVFFFFTEPKLFSRNAEQEAELNQWEKIFLQILSRIDVRTALSPDVRTALSPDVRTALSPAKTNTCYSALTLFTRVVPDIR